MRHQGKITQWNDEKGFGFVQPLKSEEQLFIHITAFKDRQLRPEINQLITYTRSTDKQGRKSTVKITRSTDKKRTSQPSKNNSFSIMLAVTFLIIVSSLVFINHTSVLILYAYLILSLITFLIYGWDKSAAQKNNWRISENNLHLLALIGGWPGALIAQKFFRHKSKKQPFRKIFWLTVGINICIFMGFLSSLNEVKIMITFLQTFIEPILPH
ncbi:MAG: DUF1294 domain-containing protein [Methylococcales bacterium]|nr:DUF1294 domain-containing protein [Methylococcales bacterium]